MPLTPYETDCRTPATPGGIQPSGGVIKQCVEVGHHAWHHVWLPLGQHCHIQREAPDPRDNISYPTLSLVLLKGLELAQGSYQTVLEGCRGCSLLD